MRDPLNTGKRDSALFKGFQISCFIEFNRKKNSYQIYLQTVVCGPL